MKKILIPVIAVACASIAVIFSACQNSSESQPSAAPTSAPVIATADESTKDESATLPKITEPVATEPSSTSEVPTARSQNRLQQNLLRRARFRPSRSKQRTELLLPTPMVCPLSPCPTIQPLSADNDQNEKTSHNRVGSCFSSDRRGFVDSSENLQSNRQTRSADSD